MTGARGANGTTVPRARGLRRALASIGALALLLAGTRPLAAQSFDCARARTPVEHRICDDAPLGALDSELAQALRAALLGPGDARNALLDEQRRWIADRDQQCLGEADTSATHLSACLTGAYRQRIAALRRRPDDPARARYLAASCTAIADRYRALADAHHGEPPLQVLAGTKTARVTVAPPLTNFDSDRGAAAGLVRWGRKQQPPVTVPADLVGEDMGNSATLEQLPDTSYYALSSVQGTAHCYDTTYFTVRNGRAREAAPPPGIDEGEGAGCMVTRSFGKLDDAPVHFEESYLYTPDMSASLQVATWDVDHFGATCSVTFQYAPEFTEETLNPSPDECSGPQCAALHRAARELVERVQANPPLTSRQTIAALSDSQRAQFLAAKRLAEAANAAPGDATAKVADDPAAIIDQTPLRLPYVLAGHVYLASIGHATIGWRYYADWSVTFEEAGQSQLLPRGTFAVGMRKGRLVSTVVKAN